MRSSEALTPRLRALPLAARVALLAGWVALLAATVVVVPEVGLATPPVSDPSAWVQWASARDPLFVVFGGLQVLVVVLAWYLIAVTTFGTVARVLRLGRLVELADLVTLPPVRRLLQTALGVGLATAGLGVVGGGADLPHEPQGPDAVVALHQHGTGVTAESLRIGGTETETLRYLGEGERETEALRLADAEADGDPAAEADLDADPTDVVRTWTVESGDHLWGIAERTLAQAWDRAPTDEEITPYWQQIIEANRDRLADPGNPDLIYPGQVIVLPDPPPAASSG